MLTGNNGILTQASNAKEKTELARIKEEADLVKLGLNIEHLANRSNTEKLKKNILLSALNDHFEESTLQTNRIVTSDGKYDIIVRNNLDIIVVKHGGQYLEEGEIELSYYYDETETENDITVEIYPEVGGLKTYQEYAEKILQGKTGAEKGKLFVEADKYYVFGNEIPSKVENITEFADWMNYYATLGVFEEGTEIPATIEEFRVWFNGKQGAELFTTVDELLIVTQYVKPAEYYEEYYEEITITCSNGQTVTINPKNLQANFTITENGTYTFTATSTNGATGEVEIEISNIIKGVEVGDYVDYEPTKTDLNKTQNVDATKLTYTSPTGGYSSAEGIITHGNGYTSTETGGGQTFTAKANDGSENGLKWRVLSVTDDKVELISDVPVKKDATSQDSGNFVLQGGIGYLYAEQELNEVCKIYGYGYGADTSVGASYSVGGPEDTQINGEIEGTGARSITIEDLNKIAGIYEDPTDGKMKYSNGTVIDSSYGTETNQTKAMYYPTLKSNNTTYPGQSASKKSGFRYTYYMWNKTEIADSNTQEMLFNGNYWLASRCIYASSINLHFKLRGVEDRYAYSYGLCNSYGPDCLDSGMGNIWAVRPVVTLRSNVIDINTDYETEGEWKLK